MTRDPRAPAGRTIEPDRFLAEAYANLAARAYRASSAVVPELGPEDVASARRALTAAQATALVAMHPHRPFNAFKISPRVKSMQRLAALDLIERGREGWLDARMTRLGREVRAKLLGD
jgi:hypothetical protein